MKKRDNRALSKFGYEIVKPLGKGCFCVGVYEALKGGEKYALKVCVEQHQFFLEKECEVLHQLNHPCILKVYDEVTSFRKKHFLALELVEGREFFDLITEYYPRSNSPPLPAVIRVARSVLSALEYMHHNGLVHNDLKPENVLVAAQKMEDINANTVVKLCDFGFVSQTDTDSSAGSPDWGSPEKFLIGRVTNKSDVFTFGLFFYAMCTGTHALSHRGQVTTPLQYRRYLNSFHQRVKMPHMQNFFRDNIAAADVVIAATQFTSDARLTAGELQNLAFFK